MKQHEFHLFEFSQKECRKYVADKVSHFVKKEVCLNKAQIVVGISGSRDSNTLIEALLCTGRVVPEQLVAVMMLGIPGWDKGKLCAEEICRRHNIPLHYVGAKTVNRLMGRTTNDDWVERFEKAFPDADLEVLGTLAVRLSLIDTAKSVGAQAIITGLNLEDILAECLLTTMQGEMPHPFPIRSVDGFPFWYPLYKIPQKILDGCNSPSSLVNYMDRHPSKMLTRANVYHSAQMKSVDSWHRRIPTS